jgi:8-oxo-dGTP diphosphatase
MLYRMATPKTPEAILAGNIAAARARRRLDQQDLADRMRALGWKWVRQTVGEVENNRRRLTAGEILGLAICLETTVPRLMAPLMEDEWIGLPNGMSLRVGAVVALVTGELPADDSPARDIRWYQNTPVRTIVPPHEAEDAPRPLEVRGRWETEETELQMPVVAAIVTSELGVLVGRRNDGKPPWTFIAGEQDAVKDENPADTAVREVKEETGLRVQAGDVIGERDHPKTGRHMIYLAATPTHGTDVFVGDEEELAEVRWVSLAELDELMGAGNIFAPVHEHLARELGEA